MKVRSNSPISAPLADGRPPLVKTAEPPPEISDGIQLSGTTAAVALTGSDQAGKIRQLAAAVGGGSYETSSVATSHAIIDEALIE
jgi:hypothetical protein